MKQPLFSNTVLIEAGLKDIENAISRSQDILKTYRELDLPLPPIDNIDDLKGLASGGETWVRNKLVDIVTKDEFYSKFDPQKAVDLVFTLPQFQTLNDKSKACCNLLSCFQYLILEKGKVIFPPNLKDQFILSNCLFPSSPEQEKLREAHEAAAIALSKLNRCIKAAGLWRLNGESAMSKYFDFPYSQNGIVEPTTLEIKVCEQWYRENLSALV